MQPQIKITAAASEENTAILLIFITIPFLFELIILNQNKVKKKYVNCKEVIKKPAKKNNPKNLLFLGLWRRHPDLNWGIKVLQTSALPLGYGAVCAGEYNSLNKKDAQHSIKHSASKWSG